MAVYVARFYFFFDGFVFLSTDQAPLDLSRGTVPHPQELAALREQRMLNREKQRAFHEQRTAKGKGTGKGKGKGNR